MAVRGLLGKAEPGIGSAHERGAREARTDSLVLIGFYAVLSTAWVLFSDRGLAALGLPRSLELLVSSTKGVAFVLVTSAILFTISVRRLTQLYSIEVRNSRLFHQAGEGMIAVEVRLDARGGIADLTVRDVNPVQAERLGMAREEVIGLHRTSPGLSDRRIRAYLELVEQGVSCEEVVRSELHLEGDVYELATAYPIEKDIWVLSAMDVTMLRRAQLELRRQEERIRQAYVDVLDAVTGGKLVVMTDDEIAEELGEPVTPSRPLHSPADLAEARETIREAVASRMPGAADSFELLSCVGEALNNALKHAGGGEYRVFTKNGSVQVCVSDEGPGIDFRTLPKATLVPGFSTASTLGMGFTIMLQLSDRVLLSTRAGHTEIVLELKTAQVRAA